MKKKKTFKNVVVFIFLKKNKILVEKRITDEISILSGQLLLPGGGVDELEDLETALVREVKEELGITPLEFILIPTSEDIYGVKEGVILRPFLINKWEGEIPEKILDEEDPLFWVDLEIMSNSQIEPTKKIINALKTHLKYEG